MTDRKIREADVEAYLVKRVAELGGVAEKFTSPNRKSVPDRIVSWPMTEFRDHPAVPAWVEFVECKRPGKKPTAAQARDHERRRKMGFKVTVVDSFEAVDKYLEETI